MRSRSLEAFSAIGCFVSMKCSWLPSVPPLRWCFRSHQPIQMTSFYRYLFGRNLMLGDAAILSHYYFSSIKALYSAYRLWSLRVLEMCHCWHNHLTTFQIPLFFVSAGDLKYNDLLLFHSKSNSNPKEFQHQTKSMTLRGPSCASFIGLK